LQFDKDGNSLIPEPELQDDTLEDANVVYEYGPKREVPRHQFQENFIRTSERSKVRIYSRKEDPLTSANP
jgi:hypothetical protein